jgi:2-oxoglutarate dehydrogenase E2 component (dihydrolipoamide succinyltransferase)
MGPLMEMRSRYKDSFKERYGVGLGFMSLFAKAVCLALREFTVINAGLDGEDLVYHDYVDLSIAVSAPRGLMVPVVRGADHLALHEIEREIARLAGKAREGTLSVDEMAGGTFTITNGGVFGSMLSTPIINAPQSAILGMHNIVERPIALQGQVVIRPIMYIALSYDHRLIDGKDSVSFLVRVKEFLEDPYRMLIEI